MKPALLAVLLWAQLRKGCYSLLLCSQGKHTPAGRVSLTCTAEGRKTVPVESFRRSTKRQWVAEGQMKSMIQA